MMKIGVLALQGGFIEHAGILKRMGVDVSLIRASSSLLDSLDGLVLPGGESTVQRKLIKETGMYESLKRRIESGIPIIGTCAGLILLASSVEGENEGFFNTLPVSVRRNGYGRQSGSFRILNAVKGVGVVPMTFIRAPLITEVVPFVDVLSSIDGNAVAVRYKNQYGLTFHPELERDEDASWIYKMAFNL